MGFFRRVVLGLEQRSAGADVAPALPLRSGASSVSVDKALGLSAVYRAVQILATTGSQLARDIEVERGGEVIDKPPLVAKPDPWRSPASFVKRYITSLACTGDAFTRKHPFVARDGIAGLEVLNPLAVFPRYDDKGRKVYDYLPAHGRPVTFTADQVVHSRLLEVPGHMGGLGPIQAARAQLAGALDLRTYADGVFREGKVPSGILSTQQQLDKTTADAYRDRFKESIAGGDVAVLGQGVDYKPVFLRPADAQWIESQQFAVTDVARMFGIPAPYLLAAVEGSSLTYQNLETVDTQFVRTTLLAYLVELEDLFAEVLPRGQEAFVRTDRLMRADARTRAEVWNAYVQMGVVDPAYVAAVERFPKPPRRTPVVRQPAPTPEESAA